MNSVHSEEDKEVLIMGSRLWALEFLVNLADQYECFFEPILQYLNISEKDQESTDFQRGFGEGVQVLIGLFIQDINYFLYPLCFRMYVCMYFIQYLCFQVNSINFPS